MSEEIKRIEAVLDEKVRPTMRAHGGEIQIDPLENGVLYVSCWGQCAGAPRRILTTENLVEMELKTALPDPGDQVVAVRPSV